MVSSLTGSDSARFKVAAVSSARRLCRARRLASFLGDPNASVPAIGDTPDAGFGDTRYGAPGGVEVTADLPAPVPMRKNGFGAPWRFGGRGRDQNFRRELSW